MEDINFNFLTFDPVTIIGVLCNTLILFLVFKKLLFGRVKKILEERADQISADYRAADTAKAQALDMKNEYTERLDKAKEESAKIVKNATERAGKRSDEIIENAKKEARSITEKANAQIEAEKKRAAISVRDEISEIVTAAAEKIVSREIASDEEQSRLIDSFIDEMGDNE